VSWTRSFSHHPQPPKVFLQLVIAVRVATLPFRAPFPVGGIFLVFSPPPRVFFLQSCPYLGPRGVGVPIFEKIRFPPLRLVFFFLRRGFPVTVFFWPFRSDLFLREKPGPSLFVCCGTFFVSCAVLPHLIDPMGNKTDFPFSDFYSYPAAHALFPGLDPSESIFTPPPPFGWRTVLPRFQCGGLPQGFRWRNWFRVLRIFRPVSFCGGYSCGGRLLDPGP